MFFKIFSIFFAHSKFKSEILREKVTTMKIRTSKTKKNIEKIAKHQNIESVF